MDVDDGEAYAEGVARGGVCGVEGAEERDGVGTAGDGSTEAVAEVEVFAVEVHAGVSLLGGRRGNADAEDAEGADIRGRREGWGRCGAEGSERE